MPLAAGIVVIGLAVGLAVGGLGMGKRSGRRGRGKPGKRQPAAADTGSAAPADAEGPRSLFPGPRRSLPKVKAPKRLEDIKSMIEPSLGRYEDVVIALKAFPGDFPGASETKEAEELLAKVEQDYGAIADAELDSARENARRLAAEGKHAEAASAVRYIRARFSGSEWFRTRGEAEIAALTGELEGAKAGPEGQVAAGTAEEAEAAAEAGEAAEVTEGLLAHWKLDEGEGTEVTDSTEGQVAGRLTGGASWIAGVQGGAVSFNGDDAYVEMGSHPALDNIQEGDYALSAWVKLNATPPGPGAEARKGSQGIVIKSSRKSLGIRYAVGGWFILEHYFIDNSSVKTVSGEAFPPGRFYHVAGTVDRTNGEVRIYVNGKLQGVERFTAGAGARVYGNAPWRIGIAEPGAGDARWALNGVVDDVRFYGRRLTDAEVAALAVGADEQALAVAAEAPPGEAGEKADNTASYITNADMSAGGETPDGWVAASSAAGKQRIVKDTVDFKAGPASLRLETAAGPVTTRVTQRLKALPQGSFTVEGYAKASGKFRFAHVILHAFDAGIKKDKWIVLANLGTKGSDWRHFSTEVVLPEWTADAHLGISFKGEGKAWLDEIRIMSEGPAPAVAAVPAEDADPTETAQEVDRTGQADQEDGLPGGPEKPLPGETGLPGQWAPGLIAEIFEGKGTAKRVAVRIDPQIDFEFAAAPLDLGLAVGPCTVRWTGWLLIPLEGKYALEVRGDQRLTVALGGSMLAEATYTGRTKSQERIYTAGLHPFSATLQASPGHAMAELRWQRPGGTQLEKVGRSYLFHKVPELGSKGPFAKLCQGIRAEYFAGENFNQKLAEDVRGHVNFDVGELPMIGAPAGVFPRDHFSIRMKGYLVAPRDGKYRFEIDANDGARLRVGGSTLIEHWRTARGELLVGETQLTAGLQELELEYMDETAEAKMKMRWDAPGWGDNFGDMPSGAFFHKSGDSATVDRAGFAPGLQGKIFQGEKPGFGRPVSETLDPSAYFNWEKRTPGAEVPKNGFSVGWSGTLIVPAAGRYLFRVRHYGGVELSIGGRRIISKWKPNEGWLESGIPLRAGPIPMTLAYFNRRDRAGLEVYWAGPGFSFRELGIGLLAHRAGELPMGKVVKEPPKPVAVAGLPAKGGATPKGPKPKGPTPKGPTPVGPQPGGNDKPDKPAPEKPPEGNQVKNGSFEEQDAQTKFPRSWKPYQWGAKGQQYSVRVMHTEAHTGETALVVKAFGDGAKPGVYTTLTLPAGKYEVSFWACADAAENAHVGGQLAGQDLADKAVGDEWQEIKETVELPERQVSASLRLWTTTKNVRIWFDDVEVNAVP